MLDKNKTKVSVFSVGLSCSFGTICNLNAQHPKIKKIENLKLGDPQPTMLDVKQDGAQKIPRRHKLPLKSAPLKSPTTA